jgi:hypothetical protein
MKKRISTRQVGDGKLPNKYWVSVFDDFLYYDTESGSWEWDSDRTREEAHGKTIAVFWSYAGARNLFDSIVLGEEHGGILVRGKTIEDRFSGEVCREVFQEVKTCEPFFEESLSFTKKKLEEAGQKFV